jgi:hypothetical protein
MLKGQELVAKVDAIRNDEANACRVIPVSEIVVACGYLKENGKPDFIAFYTELIEAKGLNEPTEDPEMSDTEAELRGRFGDDAVDAFIDYWGAEDLEHFEGAYQSAERPEDFAREIVEDCYGIDVPLFVAIDWAATWENLRHDFVELNGYIFSLNW